MNVSKTIDFLMMQFRGVLVQCKQILWLVFLELLQNQNPTRRLEYTHIKLMGLQGNVILKEDDKK